MNIDKKNILEMQNQIQEINGEKSIMERELGFLKEIKSKNETSIKELESNIHKNDEEKNKNYNYNNGRRCNNRRKTRIFKRNNFR